MPLVALLALMPAHAAPAQIEARLLRAGLTGGGTHKLRAGAWATVDVWLHNTTSGTFDGALCLEQRDRDGDVVVSRTPVALAANQARPVSIYFAATEVQSGTRLRVQLSDGAGNLVRLRDESGQEATHLVSNPLEALPSDGTVVLDFSAPRLPLLAYVRPRFPVEESRRLEILRVDAAALPERWHGLEFADVAVWDDPDLSALGSDQVRAVAEWVFQGGRLLISAGRNWQLLAASPLAEILPVRLVGTEATDRRAFVSALLGTSDVGGLGDVSGELARCRVEPVGGIAAGVFALSTPPEQAAVAYRRVHGRGVVTFVTAPLAQALSGLAPASAVRSSASDEDEEGQGAAELSDGAAARLQQLFCRLIPLADFPRESERVYSLVGMQPFQRIARQTAFIQKAGLFLVFSLVFGGGYAFIATMGTYEWLRRRQQLHHAWTAFAVAAVAATVVGSAAVWALRGVVTRVRDCQLVDGWAGLPAAQATAWFGVRTPTHTRIDVRLPIGGGAGDAADSLGPVCVPPAAEPGPEGVSAYVAPVTYGSGRDARSLEDVTVRATLKEFSGIWQGELAGRLAARLVVQRVPISEGTTMEQLVDSGFIRNELGVDLRGCVLWMTPAETVRRASDVFCFDVGDLANGQSFNGFSAWYRKPAARNAPPDDTPYLATSELPRLDQALDDWIEALGGLLQKQGGGGDAVSVGRSLRDADVAALLLTAFEVYRPQDFPTQPILGRQGGRRFAALHTLSRHCALLIGFADAAGPAALELNRRRVEASASLTIYRFLIPVERP